MMDCAMRQSNKINDSSGTIHLLSPSPCLMDSSLVVVQQSLMMETSLNCTAFTNFSQQSAIKDHKSADKEKDDVTTCHLNATMKRKRSMLTLQTKLEIIERMKKGEKVTKLALEYGLGKATVSDMKRQEEKIVSFISKSSCGLAVENRKTMRRPQDIHVEKAIYMWLNRERKRGIVITGPALMEKAKSFHRQLYGDENNSFKASSGWLHRFKLRNGIKQPRNGGGGGVCRKKLVENDNSSVQFQLDCLRRMIQDHSFGPDQIYTVTINRMHWRALPTFKSKFSRGCLTVMTCANATGRHKLRPIIVGRSRLSKVVGEAIAERLPFRYFQHDSGWVDAVLFQNWFQHEFVSQLCWRHTKALLVFDDTLLSLDQTTLASGDGRHLCVCVPHSVSFVVQPVNNALFDALKWKYRTKLLEFAAGQSHKRSAVRLSDLDHRWLTIRDAGYLLSEAWDSVSCDVIKRLWTDALYCLGAVDEQSAVVDEILNKVSSSSSLEVPPPSKEENVEQMMVTLRSCDRSVRQEDVSNWLALDGDSLRDGCVMSDKDIIECVRSDLSESESDDEVGTEDDAAGHCVPSKSEAYACFTKCLRWLECQKDCETSQLQLLWKLRNAAAKKKCKR